MGLFKRLMQPAVTSRYCLPYQGKHPMVGCILDSATHFLAELPKSHSTEEKLGAVLGFYAVTVHHIKDNFGGAWKKYFDFSNLNEDMLRFFISLNFNPEAMYWHSEQKQYVENTLRQIGPSKLSRSPICAAAMHEFNQEVFSGALRERNITTMSMDFNNQAMNFVLNCTKDNSCDDFLLMQQLGSVASTHFIGVGLVLHEFMSAAGKQRPIQI